MLNNLSISQVHQGLKNKEFSAKNLVEDYFKIIKEKDGEINSFITLMEKEALGQAKIVDQKIKQKKFGNNLLEGIPLVIKDNILIKGVLCTAASKILANYRATYDATVIKKLKEINSIFLGKTNLDEFAMGASSETSYFGPVKNPHNLSCVSGGSSGGSAAAVASGMCLGALGSDTGGSIRQPASFCGVVGLKPTYGRVSRYGLIAMASSLDQIGALAKTVEDASIILKGIEGGDAKDSTSRTPNFPIELPKNIDWRNIKVGLPKEFFSHGLDPQIKKLIDNLIKKISDAGAKIIEVSLRNLDYALASYYILMPAEVSANLARYDGIRYGHCEQKESLLEVYLKSRTNGFGDEARRRIILGTFVLSAGYYEAYYHKAQQVRELITGDFEKIFKEVDCLITPTTPTTAFKIGEKIDNPLAMYLSDIYTVPVNLAGLPAISLPIGQVDRLPVGLQIIGDHFEENKILDIAKTIESMLL
ncbi:MAG: Asp-tRNA(Asn)/Glu-tRNA(Gln) amidotransferase subunit GatA [Patescibacteria group bacterium]|nr:Asp-tRNA(Asn)/Glu-tRNA(Gln) amidotransferase subunit GatA [Patescibacteria group bacterium]MDD5121105.1 Asp-tRNA(Asn)/Glu-tRNA(Gln) amidotransferase subunit GatA [Patescibacteria group bacterium]MDD5221923.1 Asp-tRNA(Asn)/Glu-tRNA(Gln) amidotransferase subunit GatA [Patescibacteria group bacterium]MDD5395976.1 Asp-tRNA(Asn)/Glu-tRNA(Gln) amidotransferase subunit GatA [Patescibacteria group bacterium]